MTLPNLEDVKEFTHQEVLYDSLVKKSIQEGYMTEEELVIGRYLSKYCDNQSPEIIDDDFEKWEEIWRSYLPDAYQSAIRIFNIPLEKAKELLKKSLEIRAQNIPISDENIYFCD